MELINKHIICPLMKLYYVNIHIFTFKIDACFFFYICVGNLKRQNSAGRGFEEIQGKENGHISVVEKKNQERTAQSQPADGASAAKDSGSAQMIRYQPQNKTVLR